MSYSLFAVGGIQWLRQKAREEAKGKRATLPDIPLERSGFPPLFFAAQRRKARCEGAFVILNDASSKDRVRVLVQRQNSDRENNNVQTKLEQRQEITIACDRKLVRVPRAAFPL